MINKLKSVIKLMRVKHWVKNGLIFLPLFFSFGLRDFNLVLRMFIGAIAFCAVTSIVYIINDIKDREKDRLHSKKCKRPIASGAIKVYEAIILAGCLIAVSAALMIYLNSLWGVIFLLLYLILNIGYSMGLKNIPIVDILILASGFVLRVIFGAVVINAEVSSWLLFTIIAAAFFMGMGKRRNEIMTETGETRKVNKAYTKEFLDKNMYMSITLAISFYAMWCITSPTIQQFANPGIIWTVPMILVIFLRYSYIIERKEVDGDPINVLLKDYILLALVAIFVVWSIIVIYLPIPFLHELSEVF